MFIFILSLFLWYLEEQIVEEEEDMEQEETPPEVVNGAAALSVAWLEYHRLIAGLEITHGTHSDFRDALCAFAAVPFEKFQAHGTHSACRSTLCKVPNVPVVPYAVAVVPFAKFQNKFKSPS